MTSPSPAARALALLARDVPLSLLCDLVDPAGPRSHEVLESEREGAPAWWWEMAYPAPATAAAEGRTGARARRVTA